MKLFIANCTKQAIEFLYRMPESVRMFQVSIGIGKQERIHSDSLTADEVEYIVKQHRPYGLVPVDEIDRTRSFIGMCYSVDKEVNMTRVMSALEHNDDVLEERGRVTRQESAVALNNSLEQATGGTARLHHTEVAIKEETRRGDNDESRQRLDETVNVSRQNPEKAVQEPRGNRGNRRNRG